MSVCAFFLAVHGVLPEYSMASEPEVIELSQDSTLLQGRFYLGLDRPTSPKITANVMENQTEWTLQLMTETGRELPFILDALKGDVRLDAHFDEIRVSVEDVVNLSNTNGSGVIGIFPSVLETQFLIEGKGGGINLLSPYLLLSSRLTLPTISTPPVESSTPDPLSLFMLSAGGLALLSWSRRKRNKQKIHQV